MLNANRICIVIVPSYTLLFIKMGHSINLGLILFQIYGFCYIIIRHSISKVKYFYFITNKFAD